MDEDLTRKLFEKVSAAFEPYVPAIKDLEKARTCLQNYMTEKVDDLRTADKDQTEEKVEGVRGDYLQAVRANLAAKRRYEETVSTPKGQEDAAATTDSVSASGVSASALLDRHVELLRLQEQHSSLALLVDDLERVKLARGVDPEEIGGGGSSHEPDPVAGLQRETEQGDERQNKVTESIRRSVRALELAVINASREAGRQRKTLEAARSQSASTSHHSTPQRRLQAMSATRQRLTGWLEENLEKCQDGDGSVPEEERSPTDLITPSTSTQADYEEMIDRQYEEYLEARKRVLAAVGALGAPLPQEQPNIEDQSRSEQNIRTRIESDVGAQKTDILNAVEKNLMPNVQLQAASRAHLTFATEQMESEISTTVSMLDRLSDESQLLQAFPLLANSGRFQHAAAAFGRNTTIKKDKSNQVSDRIKPWVFAAEAADVATAGVLGSHLTRGQQAMDSVARNLVELRLLREARADQNFTL
jgi:hypothetical protein